LLSVNLPEMTAFATSTCRLLLGRIGDKIALPTQLDQSCAGPAARLMWQRLILSALVLILVSSRAGAACVDPTTSTHAAVSITRNFDAEERSVEPNLLGIRGTGWFLSPRSMVTVAHVAEAMHLSGQDWKDIEIREGQNKQLIPVRLSHLLGVQSEKIAVLESRAPFSGAQFLRIRTEPLVPNEHVMSVAYPGDRQRVADGRFVEYGADDKFAGTALLELYDGNDRLVLDHGASGAPVLDCEGRVVAVVSNVLTQTMQLMSRVIRISTAWNYPNVVSVPSQLLKDFSPAE
jgi:Trypsin-like peptidase domain